MRANARPSLNRGDGFGGPVRGLDFQLRSYSGEAAEKLGARKVFRERYLVPEGRLNPFSPVSAVPPGLTHYCDLFPGLRPGLLSGRPFGAGFAKPSSHTPSLAPEARLSCLIGSFSAASKKSGASKDPAAACCRYGAVNVETPGYGLRPYPDP